MKITFTIELGNEAMQTYDDVGDVLHDWINRYASQATGGQFKIDRPHAPTNIRDVNGNTVGNWKVTE